MFPLQLDQRLDSIAVTVEQSQTPLIAPVFWVIRLLIHSELDFPLGRLPLSDGFQRNRLQVVPLGVQSFQLGQCVQSRLRAAKLQMAPSLFCPLSDPAVSAPSGAAGAGDAKAQQQKKSLALESVGHEIALKGSPRTSRFWYSRHGFPGLRLDLLVS